MTPALTAPVAADDLFPHPAFSAWRRRLQGRDPGLVMVQALSAPELDSLLDGVAESEALQYLAGLTEAEADAALARAFVGMPGLRALLARLCERLRRQDAHAA